MCWNNSSFCGCYDPELHMSVIHPLRMPYFSQKNKFIVDNLAKNTCNKTRNHVIVGEKASEIFKLVLSVQAGLKHKVRLTKDHML